MYSLVYFFMSLIERLVGVSFAIMTWGADPQKALEIEVRQLAELSKVCGKVETYVRVKSYSLSTMSNGVEIRFTYVDNGANNSSDGKIGAPDEFDIEHYENGIYVIGEGGTAEYIHGRLEVGGYGSKRILEDVRKVQSNPPAVCKGKSQLKL